MTFEVNEISLHYFKISNTRIITDSGREGIGSILFINTNWIVSLNYDEVFFKALENSGNTNDGGTNLGAVRER